MMKEFANAKENYDSIPIPAELPDRVQAGIQLGKASYRRRRNRMIRRWFPKGTDFGRVTKRQIAAIQDWMNGYPRRILGWKTPLEAAS